jgi:hypothetical protein
MPSLTPEGRRIVESVAVRHGVSTDAALCLLTALAAGGGRQAQFSHPELGGMGQWSQGGMVMVGDMFNHGLKARVDALCNDLAAVLADSAPFAPVAQAQSQTSSGSVSLFVPGSSGGYGQRWPADLGAPASTGSQNDLHYAVFPTTRRLAIEQNGRLSVYDTGDHSIGGVSQAQSGDQSLTFTSQLGLVRVADLAPVTSAQASPEPAWHETPAPTPPAPSAATPPTDTSDDVIFSRIERLAELAQKGAITQAEFDAKKAELLARL